MCSADLVLAAAGGGAQGGDGANDGRHLCAVRRHDCVSLQDQEGWNASACLRCSTPDAPRD